VALCACPAPAGVQARGDALHDGHVRAAVGHAGQQLLRLQRVGRLGGRGRLAHVRRQVERRAAVPAGVTALMSAAGRHAHVRRQVERRAAVSVELTAPTSTKQPKLVARTRLGATVLAAQAQ